jgi:hypothetical protein
VRAAAYSDDRDHLAPDKLFSPIPLLTELNGRPFQKLPGSRASVFATIDAPAMGALPSSRYEYACFKTVRVNVNYHVEIEAHRYSVPHALVGEQFHSRRAGSHIADDQPRKHLSLLYRRAQHDRGESIQSPGTGDPGASGRR